MKAHLDGMSWERTRKKTFTAGEVTTVRHGVQHGYAAGDHLRLTMAHVEFSAIILPAGFWQQLWFLLRRGAG